MITLPDKVNASWIATLGDKQLVDAEKQLHTLFVAAETTEKKRAGSRYEMMRGPAELMDAWLRWLLVNNETKNRGVTVKRSKR